VVAENHGARSTRVAALNLGLPIFLPCRESRCGAWEGSRALWSPPSWSSSGIGLTWLGHKAVDDVITRAVTE
jgi:hypothetical protein